MSFVSSVLYLCAWYLTLKKNMDVATALFFSYKIASD